MDTAVYQKMSQVERHHWWFKARRNLLLTAIKNRASMKPNSSILDVGCGTGYMTEGLTSLGQVTGVDSHTEALNLFLKDTSCKTLTTDQFLSNQSLHQKFDLACFFDVIEHTQNDAQFLKKYLPFLKNNALIVISVPAFQIFWGTHDVVSRHFRRYRKAEVQKLMLSLGFEPVFQSYFNFFLSPLVLLHRILDRITNRQSETGDLTLPNYWINTLFYLIFNLEHHWIRWIRFLKFPVGVSFLGIYRKKTLPML